MPELQSIHFYDELIEVIFDTPPAREKSPGCPNGFIWEEQTYLVVESCPITYYEYL